MAVLEAESRTVNEASVAVARKLNAPLMADALTSVARMRSQSAKAPGIILLNNTFNNF